VVNIRHKRKESKNEGQRTIHGSVMGSCQVRTERFYVTTFSVPPTPRKRGRDRPGAVRMEAFFLPENLTHSVYIRFLQVFIVLVDK